MDVTVAVMTKSGDRMLKRKWKSCAFKPTERQLLSMALEQARQVESWKFPWPCDYKSPTCWYWGACIRIKLRKWHIVCYCLRHVKQNQAWQNVCVTVQSHWMTTTYNHWKLLDKSEQICSWLELIIWLTTIMYVTLSWMILSKTLTMNLWWTARLEI